MKFKTKVSDEAAFLRDSTPEKQMLFELLEIYWGEGDGDKPPQFIFDAARMCGYPLDKASAPVVVVVAVNECGDHKTGSLPSNITPAQIQQVLGFKANIDDDESKVKYSWGFTVNGKRAGIWDYKGSRWSVYDPAGVVPALFASIIGIQRA